MSSKTNEVATPEAFQDYAAAAATAKKGQRVYAMTIPPGLKPGIWYAAGELPRFARMKICGLLGIPIELAAAPGGPDGDGKPEKKPAAKKKPAAVKPEKKAAAPAAAKPRPPVAKPVRSKNGASTHPAPPPTPDEIAASAAAIRAEKEGHAPKSELTLEQADQRAANKALPTVRPVEPAKAAAALASPVAPAGDLPRSLRPGEPADTTAAEIVEADRLGVSITGLRTFKVKGQETLAERQAAGKIPGRGLTGAPVVPGAPSGNRGAPLAARYDGRGRPLDSTGRIMILAADAESIAKRNRKTVAELSGYVVVDTLPVREPAVA